MCLVVFLIGCNWPVHSHLPTLPTLATWTETSLHYLSYHRRNSNQKIFGKNSWFDWSTFLAIERKILVRYLTTSFSILFPVVYPRNMTRVGWRVKDRMVWKILRDFENICDTDPCREFEQHCEVRTHQPIRPRRMRLLFKSGRYSGIGWRLSGRWPDWL